MTSQSKSRSLEIKFTNGKTRMVKVEYEYYDNPASPFDIVSVTPLQPGCIYHEEHLIDLVLAQHSSSLV